MEINLYKIEFQLHNGIAAMGKPDNEYTFLLIDCSNSMMKPSILHEEEKSGKKKKKKKKKKKNKGEAEFIPRLNAAILASEKIINTKKRKIETDKFGIIVYNDNEAKVVQELTNDHDALIQSLHDMVMETERAESNQKKLTGAFALVIQQFANQLKFVGNIMLRVFILTDDLDELTSQEIRLTEIARDIGVYVDILYLGPIIEDNGFGTSSTMELEGIDEDIDADGYFIDREEMSQEDVSLDFALDDSNSSSGKNVDKDLLEEKGLLIPGLEPETLEVDKKRTKQTSTAKKKKFVFKDTRLIAQMTDGLFLAGKENMEIIMQHAVKLGDIKDLEEGLGAFESAPVRKKKLMSAIAEELVPLGISELQDALEGKSNLKCNICFQEKSPNGGPFYATGRRCSYCSRTMHLECAAKWAEQDQGSEESFIFRCPFCFHLLKVDPSVSKLMDLQIIRQNVARMEAEKKHKPKQALAKRLTPAQILELVEPCEVCGVILETEDKGLQCSNCGAVYHEKCFNRMLEQNELHCRRCGYEFSSWD